MSSRQRNSIVQVGVLTTSFPVPGYPASGIFVYRLAKALATVARVEVCCPRSDVAGTPESGPQLIVRDFSYAPRPWRQLAHRPGGIPLALQSRSIAALLLLPVMILAMSAAAFGLAGRVDVVHGNWSLPGLLGAVAARLRGRVAVMTLRGEDVARAHHSWFARRILALGIRANYATAVVSEAMTEDLRQLFPRFADRVQFVPNGVDIAAPQARKRFHAPLRVITVGSLIPRKDTETMIRAIDRLRYDQQVVFRIVGSGPQQGSLHSLVAQLKLEDSVEFVGMASPESVQEHLRWADIFLFASLSEGRPNALLEAMGAGLPIVATDISGVRELLDAPARGYLFPAGDVDACAVRLGEVTRDPTKALAAGADAQRYIVETGLTWRNTADCYAALYRQARTRKGQA